MASSVSTSFAFSGSKEENSSSYSMLCGEEGEDDTYSLSMDDDSSSQDDHDMFFSARSSVSPTPHGRVKEALEKEEDEKEEDGLDEEGKEGEQDDRDRSHTYQELF